MELSEVTILIPNYNGGKYIYDSVLSALNQTVSCNVLVVDNGSTDDSLIILKKLESIYENLEIIFEHRRGITYALNTGLDRIQTKYIARLDSDDKMKPERIQKQLEFFSQNPKAILVGSNLELIDKNGEILGLKYYPTTNEAIKKSISFMNPIAHPSVMVETTIIKNIKYSDLFSGAEDLNLWINIMDLGSFHNIDTPLTQYRLHNDQLTMNRNYYRTELRVRLAHLRSLFTLGKGLTLLRILDLIFMAVGLDFHRKFFRKVHLNLTKAPSI